MITPPMLPPNPAISQPPALIQTVQPNPASAQQGQVVRTSPPQDYFSHIAPQTAPGIGEPSSVSTGIGTAPTATTPTTDVSFLRIIHNNDPHEKFSIMPRLTTAFNQLSQEGAAQGEDVIRLNAGDNNIGPELRDWQLNVLLMNLQRLHAVTMGNHELDQGLAHYAEGLKQANFPTLVNNLYAPTPSSLSPLMQTGQFQSNPLVVNGQNGHRYGIIGVTTPNLTSYLANGIATEGVLPLALEQTVERTQYQMDQLRAQGVKNIVLLSHMGYNSDFELASELKGSFVIVGGHSHDELEDIIPGQNWVRSATGEPVLILQVGKNDRHIGVSDVAFTPEGQVVPIRTRELTPFAFPEDPTAKALITQTLGPPRPLATIITPYDNENIQFAEDPVANFTADAMRAMSGADIAFVRAPVIRDDIRGGVLTDQRLKEIMPFADPVVKTTLTGAEIMAGLERSAQILSNAEQHPGILHPSGLMYSVDTQDGSLGPVTVQNRQTGRYEPIDPNRAYSVALDWFGATNQSEYPELGHPERIQWNSGRSIAQAFEWGLQQAGAPLQPISFSQDGRLKVFEGFVELAGIPPLTVTTKVAVEPGTLGAATGSASPQNSPDRSTTPVVIQA